MPWLQPHRCGLLEMQEWEHYRLFGHYIMVIIILCHNDARNLCLSFSLQRLAEDSNPAIAAAATKAIFELKRQWEIEEGDSWRFTMNRNPIEEWETQEADDNEDTD